MEANIIRRGNHRVLPCEAQLRTKLALWSYITQVPDQATLNNRKVTPGRTYYKVNRLTQLAEKITSLASDQIPFSIEFPLKSFTNMEVMIVASGTPGTEYEVLINGGVLYRGVIEDNYRHKWLVNAGGLTGKFPISVRIRYPSQVSFVPVTESATATGKSLDITLEPLPIGDVTTGELLNKIENKDILTGWADSSWGYSEY